MQVYVLAQDFPLVVALGIVSCPCPRHHHHRTAPDRSKIQIYSLGGTPLEKYLHSKHLPYSRHNGSTGISKAKKILRDWQ